LKESLFALEGMSYRKYDMRLGGPEATRCL